MKLEENKLKKIDLVIAFSLLALALMVFISDSLNRMQYDYISLDESYNATVAANVVRYGEYRVSYPSNMNFYIPIPTGQTVILPTALLFKIFGINPITCAMVPLIFSVGTFLLIFFIFKVIFSNWGKYTTTLSAILTVLLIMSDGNYQYISTRLIGEIAAIFFMLVALFMLIKFYQTNKNLYMIITGSMMAAAFITKSSTIFMLVTITGLIIFETRDIRELKIKTLLSYFAGFFAGFAFLESYKLFQLGSWDNYLKWWQAEWKDMLSQSSGVVTTYSFESKYQYLNNIFSGYTPAFSLLLIVLPILIYFFTLQKKYIRSEAHAFSIVGIAGTSLEIFFLLLGGGRTCICKKTCD